MVFSQSLVLLFRTDHWNISVHLLSQNAAFSLHIRKRLVSHWTIPLKHQRISELQSQNGLCNVSTTMFADSSFLSFLLFFFPRSPFIRFVSSHRSQALFRSRLTTSSAFSLYDIQFWKLCPPSSLTDALQFSTGQKWLSYSSSSPHRRF